ncbi:MAG TPA: hypothetical protein VJX30_03060 [Terriglobales bacterium]|nr:hypothetical protein [Terriglobales bacterium]
MENRSTNVLQEGSLTPPDLSDILEQDSATVYNSDGGDEGDEYG